MLPKLVSRITVEQERFAASHILRRDGCDRLSGTPGVGDRDRFENQPTEHR